jgi:hypothetical protein
MESGYSLPRTPAYYLERAAECERLADEATIYGNLPEAWTTIACTRSSKR